MNVDEARAHQSGGEFPEGSMGPKIRAAIEFVQATGREVLITSSARLLDAVHGTAGTRVVPAATPRGEAGTWKTPRLSRFPLLTAVECGQTPPPPLRVKK